MILCGKPFKLVPGARYLVDVNLSFTEADALGNIRFDTSCRQQVMHPLQLENPLSGPATCAGNGHRAIRKHFRSYRGLFPPLQAPRSLDSSGLRRETQG